MAERPTRVRYRVVAMGTVIAILLYLDRYCLSLVDRRIVSDLGFEERQIAFIHSSFFWTYALGQLPFGYLADRFGPRRVLSGYVVIWSALTAMMGLAKGFTDLLIFRLGCGLFESGAYPACSGMIRRWVPVTQRGAASGVVSMGGRIGGAVTPSLVAQLLILFGGIASVNAMFSGQTWRPTFLTFGAVGILVGLYFALRHRDDPAEHPGVNDAELALIKRPPPALSGRAEHPVAVEPPRLQPSAPLPFFQLLPRLLTNFHFWLLSAYQFGANFGWVIFMTYLNRFLIEVHGLTDDRQRADIQTAILLIALPALILGGWLTDAMAKKWGPRLGRVIPLTVPRMVAGLAFAAVVLVEPGATWTLTAVLGTVIFFSELCLPAIWAYCMDVGGPNTALVLGWGNMIGNLGAAVSPLVVASFVESYGWNAVWYLCSGVFIGMSLLCLGIDSRQKIAD